MPDKIIDIPGLGQIAFPDTMSDADINASAERLYRQKNPGNSRKQPRTWLDTAVDAIPSIAGAAGGVIGGIGGTAFGMGVGGFPGAVGGAALGGAAGEGAKQLINRARGAEAPQTSADAALGIAKEGGAQAASEVAGQGLMKAGSMAAHGLMDFAIRPSPTVAREFGDVAATAIKERLPVNSLLPGMQKGSEKAAAKLAASSRALRALLQKAGASGDRISNNQVAAPILDLVDEIAKQPLGEQEMKQLDGMISEFLQRHPGPLTPDAVKDLKQSAQSVARTIYKAEAAGNYNPAASLNARFNEKIASGAKSSLEALPTHGADIAAQEGTTQKLIGVNAAIAQAERRRLPLSAEAASAVAGAVGSTLKSHGFDLASDLPTDVGRGIAAWLATRSLLSPRVTSRGALFLTNRQVQQMIREVPRLGDYVVREVRGAGSQPATPEAPEAPVQ